MLQPIRHLWTKFDYDSRHLSPNVDGEQVELSFKQGDRITIYGDMDQDGFFYGELNGSRGLVPSNFLTTDIPLRFLPSNNKPKSMDNKYAHTHDRLFNRQTNSLKGDPFRQTSQTSATTGANSTVKPTAKKTPGQGSKPVAKKTSHAGKNNAPAARKTSTATKKTDSTAKGPGRLPSPIGVRHKGEPTRHLWAKFDYDSRHLSPNIDGAEVELSFKQGDRITIYGEMDEDGFFYGELNGSRGLVPSNFVTDEKHEHRQ